MIEGGVFLLIVGMLLSLASPVEKTIAHRRYVSVDTFEETLRHAFPMLAPSPALDELTRRAEEALEQDALARGVAAIAVTYDHARDGDARGG